MRQSDAIETAAIWFLIGAGVGAATALMYSPASGEKNRKRLVRTIEDTSDNISDTAERLLKRGRALIETANEMLEKARVINA